MIAPSAEPKMMNVPTPLTHSLVALGLGRSVWPGRMPWRFWFFVAACAALPDVDTIGFALGIRYDDMLGHRGLTHSLPFALALSLLVVLAGQLGAKPLSRRWWAMLAFFFAISASHGLLDAMTDGGRGVAFFAPFSNERYFLPWQPLRVSPIGLRRFLTPRGAEVLWSEFVYLWVPTAVIVLAANAGRVIVRWRRRAAATEPNPGPPR